MMTGFPARSRRDRFWSGVTRNVKSGAATPGARRSAIDSSPSLPIGGLRRRFQTIVSAVRDQPLTNDYLRHAIHRLDGGQDSPVLFARRPRAASVVSTSTTGATTQ